MIETTSGVNIWTDSAAAIARINVLSWSMHKGRRLAISLFSEIIDMIPVTVKVKWITQSTSRQWNGKEETDTVIRNQYHSIKFSAKKHIACNW